MEGEGEGAAARAPEPVEAGLEAVLGDVVKEITEKNGVPGE